MISKKFQTLALGATLALTTAFSTPAMAGKDFFKKDLREETTKVVELVGSSLSKDKLTFVVHGGNKKLMNAAFRTAMRLDDEGIPVAFLLAPDRDGLPQTMHIDFYGKGGTRYGATAYDNDKNTVSGNESIIYDQAMKAVSEDFPEYVAVSTDYRKTDHLLAVK